MIDYLVFLRADRLCAAAAITLAGAVPMLFAARHLDTRQLSGDGIWSKPFNFALSLSFHFATFAVMVHWLPRTMQEGAALRIATLVSVAAGMFEFAYIAIQAARGRHSHFNASTRIEAAMSALMGLGAVFVLAPAVVIGIDAAIGPLPEWASSVRTGVAAGLLGGTALTILTGFRMGAVTSHFAGAPPAKSRKMRLTGWSLDGADLRPPHFLAAHMMQVVPIAAVCASLLLPHRAALFLAALFSLGWAALTLKASASASSGHRLPRIFGFAAAS